MSTNNEYLGEVTCYFPVRPSPATANQGVFNPLVLSPMNISPNHPRFLIFLLCIMVASLSLAQTPKLVAPSFSEYSVTFPDEPKSMQMQAVTIEGQDIHAIRSELLQGSTMLRAEFAPTNSGLRQQISEEFAMSGLKQYAFHNGIQHPEFFYEEAALGPIARLRGTKIINHDNKELALTIEARFYYGNSSILSIYTAAPSTEYPSQRITSFLDSVELTGR